MAGYCDVLDCFGSGYFGGDSEMTDILISKILVHCAACGRELYRKPSQIKKTKRSFCYPCYKPSKIRIYCENCQKEIERWPHLAKGDKHHFCGHNCYQEFRKKNPQIFINQKYTEEKLLGILRETVNQLGQIPLSSYFDQNSKLPGLPARRTFLNYFGSYNNALRKAGLRIFTRHGDIYQAILLEDWAAAFIAGIIDGEGNITKRGRLSITNTDLCFLDTIRRLTRAGKIMNRTIGHPHLKNTWEMAFTQSETKGILLQTLAYLVVKKEKAVAALHCLTNINWKFQEEDTEPAVRDWPRIRQICLKHLKKKR